MDHEHRDLYYSPFEEINDVAYQAKKLLAGVDGVKDEIKWDLEVIAMKTVGLQNPQHVEYKIREYLEDKKQNREIADYSVENIHQPNLTERFDIRVIVRYTRSYNTVRFNISIMM